jgi:hypothetical protein
MPLVELRYRELLEMSEVDILAKVRQRKRRRFLASAARVGTFRSTGGK